ncbi:hypothetical protein [Caldivirga sp.]|uniref:hypothetical protein n=1 Tax=Caldivirga sp. TaxID=2080243 RepID=UPI003D0CBBAB
MNPTRLMILALVMGLAVVLVVLPQHTLASGTAEAGLVTQNATCTAASVHVELSLTLYQRVKLVAGAMGELGSINATLNEALNLTMMANESLGKGLCLTALEEALNATHLEQEAWGELMINATRVGLVNYTCINLISTAEARLKTVLSLTQNSTIRGEAEALLRELGSLNCSKANEALTNATMLLNETRLSVRSELGNWLRSRVESVALVYVGVGEYGGIGELASLNLTEYWRYIMQALESAMVKYANELNASISRLMASGNLRGLIELNGSVGRLATTLTILSRHGVKVNDAWSLCANASSLINNTLTIYRELNGNATKLNTFSSLVAQVYLSYLNGSLQLAVSKYANSSWINETMMLLGAVNRSMRVMVGKGYLKQDMGLMIVAVPIPEPMRGLISRYLNLTIGNLTLSMANLGLCSNAYLITRNMTALRVLNATSIIKLAYSLYLMRVYCPMALQYAKLASGNLIKLEELINVTQH